MYHLQKDSFHSSFCMEETQPHDNINSGVAREIGLIVCKVTRSLVNCWLVFIIREKKEKMGINVGHSVVLFICQEGNEEITAFYSDGSKLAFSQVCVCFGDGGQPHLISVVC